MKLLRQRPQRFGQQVELFHAHRELAFLRLEQYPSAEDIAAVVMFERRVLLLAG